MSDKLQFVAGSFGVRRPVTALVGCDLSQPLNVQTPSEEARRQAAAKKSGDRSPHSKKCKQR
jgi:hypothetical protein